MRRIFQVIAWTTVVGIVVVSVGPSWMRPVTDASHNVEHFTAFLISGLAFGFVYPRRHLLQMIGLLLFTFGIEIAQLWAPDRHARLGDLVVDALAVSVGVGLAFFWTSYRSTVPRDPDART